MEIYQVYAEFALEAAQRVSSHSLAPSSILVLFNFEVSTTIAAYIIPDSFPSSAPSKRELAVIISASLGVMVCPMVGDMTLTSSFLNPRGELHIEWSQQWSVPVCLSACDPSNSSRGLTYKLPFLDPEMQILESC